MANICLTSVCNRQCSYCFAQEHVDAPDFMSIDDFKRSLGFLEGSKIDQVRILGGEPTLHPDFKEIMALTKDTGQKILLFTNGFFSDEILNYLMNISPEILRVMVNVTPLDSMKEKVIARQRHVIKKLGPRAALSFNIYRPNISFDVLIELIEGSEAQKMVRLGLALPCLHGNNESLYPRQYPYVGSRIVSFATQAANHDIRISFDCGFVQCMFSNEGLEALKLAKADIGWRCNPILDITPAGQVLHCFPLAEMYSKPLKDGFKAGVLRAEFVEQSKDFRQAGIYRDCYLCDLKHSKVCLGGCLAATIRRFHPQSGNG